MRDWQAVRHAADIQYAPLQIPDQKVEIPGWLQWLGKALEAIFGPLGRWLGIAWPVFEKILLALAVVLLALLLWQVLRRLRLPRKAQAPEAAHWTPDRAAALVLLEDADRLAAEGRYDEAAHLLLQRSVGQIGAARPDWLGPASTAREITHLPGLPEGARRAFAVIAGRVERSLFALRPLGREDWTTARAAYADFALAPLPSADGAR
ncbi:hypothetical protein H7F51_02300 [Novosphingobium flavum]|uniref:DUF4129 domain-containing protein n=1 Tax=Novosphingobium flavum TaxID=1778672 RepID=A0A7X1FP80_9SPHN|nr:hypothetical protein [Novosphingobium flavum]MBC2664343.1 hypothetical protein [Novosphingobium flavum]